MGQHKADESFCFFFQKEALALTDERALPQTLTRPQCVAVGLVTQT
jgi:hypothetical protein